MKKGGRLQQILPIFLINVNRSAKSTGDSSLIRKMHILIFHAVLPRTEVNKHPKSDIIITILMSGSFKQSFTVSFGVDIQYKRLQMPNWHENG